MINNGVTPTAAGAYPVTMIVSDQEKMVRRNPHVGHCYVVQVVNATLTVTDHTPTAPPRLPTTGDNAHTPVWALLAVLSLSGVILLDKKRRQSSLKR